jgi:phosphate transport system permease protein
MAKNPEGGAGVTSIDDANVAIRSSKPRRAISNGRAGDRLFAGLARGSGSFVLVIMAAIAAFLIWKAYDGLTANEANFLTSQEWNPNATPARFGVAQLAFGTLMSSVIALILATPVAIGIALFTAFYAPRKLASLLGYVIDLLAAVPSIVYGLWGATFFVVKMQSVSEFLNSYFGWFPLFGGNETGGRTLLTAGVVLAIMILPIISAISREIFLQVPRANMEAALALGATRWEMIRGAVLPHSRSGLVGAVMLGLGRAMGETIAVALVIGSSPQITARLFSSGDNLAAVIANQFGEAGGVYRSALVALGVILFAMTVLVVVAARAVVGRGAEARAS